MTQYVRTKNCYFFILNLIEMLPEVLKIFIVHINISIGTFETFSNKMFL